MTRISVTQATPMEGVAVQPPDGVVSLSLFFAQAVIKHLAKSSQETPTSIAQPDVNLPLEAAAPLHLHLHLHMHHCSHLRFRNPPHPHLRNQLRLHSRRRTHHQYQGTLRHQTKRVACGK